MGKKRLVEVIARGVFVRDGRILLCHSRGAWNTYLPGGHVEFGESAAESLHREIEEEAGLRARVGRFLGAVEHTFVQKGERHCELNLVFCFQIPGWRGADAPASREEKIEFAWASLARLAKVHLEPSVLQALIPRWIRARGKPAKGWASTYGR